MTLNPPAVASAPASDCQGVTVTITRPVTHRCPFVPEIDRGAVRIAWRCAGATVELHSLAAFLDHFRDQPISHEHLTHLTYNALALLPGIAEVAVETTFTTAGNRVRCRMP